MSRERKNRQNNIVLLEEQYGSQVALTDAINKGLNANDKPITPAQLSQWKGGRSFGDKATRKVEKGLGLSPEWMDVPHQKNDPNTPFIPVGIADETNSLPIKLIEAKGSCGGGTFDFTELAKDPIQRELKFFSKYGVKNTNVIAIYADGNSMADYINDGDIVLINTAQKDPLNRKIFLLKTKHGLRIKELIETSNGKWKIRSRNPAFSDEEITEADQIEIMGMVFYRQG